MKMYGIKAEFQGSQCSRKTWKTREKFGKFEKSGKTWKTHENFLENHNSQGKLRENF